MLKAHYLSTDALAELGYRQFDHMRLNNVQEVATPGEADVIVIPLPARAIIQDCHKGIHMDDEGLARIVQHFNLDPRRVTAYDCSDWEQTYERTREAMLVRGNTRKWYLDANPRTISWPWPVEDWSEVVPLPEGGFKFDVSFHGWLSHKTRVDACESVKLMFGARADIVTRKEFWGYLERDKPEIAIPMKAAMKASMQASRISLCPQSIPGVFPYRFFEAMSAGRVPALFCTDYVLPWADKIDYESCCAIFRADEAAGAGRLIHEFLSKHSDAELIEMGRRGRAFWDQWLNRTKFEDLKTVAIEESLRKAGLLA